MEPVWNSRKQLPIHTKYSEQFTAISLVRVPSDGLNYSERDVKNFKMIQGVDDRQLLEVREELQMFANWCSEIVQYP